jgi:hypothetical protein
MKSSAHVYYQAVDQIIIGVVLEDGRRFSIDLKVPTDLLEHLRTTGEDYQPFEVLASGRVDGRSVN